MEKLSTIPFNKPFLTGKETCYIEQAVKSGKISGDGIYTWKCHEFLEKRFGFKKCLLTSSCTDALEMAAILIDIKPGDEVIMPSYTFVSTANAFILRGAVIVFADCHADRPGMDENLLENLISPRTKAIVPVHYAGVACDMERIMLLANKYNVFVVEDAAQAIDSYYTFSDGTRKFLGSIGHMATFSFHETKNVIAGEGGMLAINDEKFIKRAEIIREKGTNRSSFFRGEVDKYRWVDVGSSFLPSEIIAAFLWAQLEKLDTIQNRRMEIWNYYHNALCSQEKFKTPQIPSFASNNAHMYYLVFYSEKSRSLAIQKCKEAGIHLVFHYLSLHKSPFYKNKHDGRSLPESDKFMDCLLRLPFYYELSFQDQDRIINALVR